MATKVKFSYINRHGVRIIHAVDQRDAVSTKIFLLEESFTGKIGDIYEFVNSEWKLLDYYND